MLHLTRDDPATIAFVLRCLQRGAIGAAEVREWAEETLLHTGGDCPIYVEGLTVFDGTLAEALHVVAFTPERRFGAEEDAALDALAALRKQDAAEPDDDGGAAARLEQRYPDTLREFRAAFPFLRLP